METDREFFVATTTDKVLANQLSQELRTNFRGTWICLWNLPDVHKVSCANEWGNRLDQSKEDEITLFVQKFLQQKPEQSD